MVEVRVTIVQFIDDYFPGFVECVLVDSDDYSHRFIEKAPVVSIANLSPDTVFPQAGHIACLVEDDWIDERGRLLVRVSTTNPWGIASTAGETTFTILRDKIVRA